MNRLLYSAAAIAACVLLSSGVASASPCTGVCADGYTPINPNGTFGDSLISTGSAVFDQYDFSLVSPPNVDQEAVDSITVHGGNIVGLTLGFYLANGTLIQQTTATSTDLLGDQEIALAVDLGTAPFPGIGYYWQISGTDTTSSSGTVSYAGNVNTSPTDLSSVPLPGALSLFAGGIGLLGFAGLRRRNKAAQRVRIAAA